MFWYSEISNNGVSHLKAHEFSVALGLPTAES